MLFVYSVGVSFVYSLYKGCALLRFLFNIHITYKKKKKKKNHFSFKIQIMFSNIVKFCFLFFFFVCNFMIKMIFFNDNLDSLIGLESYVLLCIMYLFFLF